MIGKTARQTDESGRRVRSRRALSAAYHSGRRPRLPRGPGLTAWRARRTDGKRAPIGERAALVLPDPPAHPRGEHYRRTRETRHRRGRRRRLRHSGVICRLGESSRSASRSAQAPRVVDGSECLASGRGGLRPVSTHNDYIDLYTLRIVALILFYT